MSQLTAIDLFAGMGGLTCGLSKAEFRVLAAVEIDEVAAATYRENHPSVDLIPDDIRKVNPSDVAAKIGLAPGQLDLLAGCPPCQGFSRVNSRNGRRATSSDERNDLVFEFVRFATFFQPRAVLLENVPGLQRDARFPELVEQLEALGYVCNADVIDAADYGVPQHRKRLMLVAGHRKKISMAGSIARRATVRDALVGLDEHDRWHNRVEKRSPRIRELIENIPPDGGSRSSLPKHLQLKCHQGFDGFSDVYGRMAWDRPAPTITGGCVNPSRGRFLHPEEHRAITVREASLLQSFPPEYKLPRTGKYEAAQHIGNAVPPQLGFAQGAAIASQLD